MERSKADTGDWAARQDMDPGPSKEFNLKFEDDVMSRGSGRLSWLYSFHKICRTRLDRQVGCVLRGDYRLWTV